MTGMGRNGTSLVAASVAALGVNLGDRLMVPNSVINPIGFFEDDDIRRLDNEVAGLFGGHFTSLSVAPDGFWSSPGIRPYLDRAEALLRSKCAGAEFFGFKDPSISQVLPLWQEVFARCGLDDSYVLVIRNPLSVADSFKRMGELDPRKSHLIWLQRRVYTMSLVWDRPCVVVDYDCVLADPVAETRRIALTLGLPWDEQVEARAEIFSRTIVSERLRHTRHAPEDVAMDRAVPPIVARAYGLLDTAARDASAVRDADFRQKWLAIEAQFKDFNPAFNLFEEVDRALFLLTAWSLLVRICRRRMQVFFAAVRGDQSARDRLWFSLTKRLWLRNRDRL